MKLKTFWMCIEDKTSENNYPHWSGDYFLVWVDSGLQTPGQAWML